MTAKFCDPDLKTTSWESPQSPLKVPSKTPQSPLKVPSKSPQSPFKGYSKSPQSPFKVPSKTLQRPLPKASPKAPQSPPSNLSLYSYLDEDIAADSLEAADISNWVIALLPNPDVMAPLVLSIRVGAALLLACAQWTRMSKLQLLIALSIYFTWIWRIIFQHFFFKILTYGHFFKIWK